METPAKWYPVTAIPTLLLTIAVAYTLNRILAPAENFQRLPQILEKQHQQGYVVPDTGRLPKKVQRRWMFDGKNRWRGKKPKTEISETAESIVDSFRQQSDRAATAMERRESKSRGTAHIARRALSRRTP
ncbi:hypothetical protein ColTof3_11117 [Colletotrichum tofieldiae]|nr:hypothetical protein ColTof3_11117 [Colletotrichum tofieldiae]